MAAGMGVGVVSALARPPLIWPAPDYGSVAASVRRNLSFSRPRPRQSAGRWIQPGMTVVVKPNWVKHEFGSTEGRNVLFTHASLVRALIDAALRALGGGGRVYVVDAPLQGCDFARLRRQNGLAEMEQEYAHAPVAFLDLRQQWAEIDDASSYVRGVHPLAGDVNGYSMVDLGARSRLVCFGVNARFGVTDYNARQGQSRRCYPISNTVLSADVILNVPKLKTHMKTGMTGALKNFVGIMGAKDFLPHFRPASPRAGGDEYPDQNWVSRAASPIRELLQTRAPLCLWKMARAGGHGGFHAVDSRWRMAWQRYALAHHPRPGGYRAQLQCGRRAACAAAYHSHTGGCGGRGRRLRSLEAAAQAVAGAGLGRGPGCGGCGLRHIDGFRLAQDSIAQPSARCRSTGFYAIPWRDPGSAWRHRGF